MNDTSGSQTNLAQTHDYKQKTAGSQTTQTVLDHWPKIAIITGKQNC